MCTLLVITSKPALIFQQKTKKIRVSKKHFFLFKLIFFILNLNKKQFIKENISNLSRGLVDPYFNN